MPLITNGKNDESASHQSTADILSRLRSASGQSSFRSDVHSGVLDKVGHKVEILDAFMTGASFRKIGDTIIVGMPYERIKEEIRRRKPDIVGIANPFTCLS